MTQSTSSPITRKALQSRRCSPAAVPILLINGSTGIAVGMIAASAAQFKRVLRATCAIIDNPAITIDEIIEASLARDFPTGGTVAGKREIEKHMSTGRGILKTRGTAKIEELPNDKEQIIITETPYNVNRATLVTKIAAQLMKSLLKESRT